MQPPTPPKLDPLQRLQTFVNLTPIVGILPSLWTIYIGHEKGPVRDVSRLAVVLGMSWLVATVLLSVGGSAHVSQVATLRFWLASSFVGSGYFLLNIWLMWRIWKGQSIKLPGITQLSKRLP
ncbi:MAG: hypothetical protein AAGC54_19080 [Cyanobacteria bacterium P01_F01_bin.4]